MGVVHDKLPDQAYLYLYTTVVQRTSLVYRVSSVMYMYMGVCMYGMCMYTVRCTAHTTCSTHSVFSEMWTRRRQDSVTK